MGCQNLPQAVFPSIRIALPQADCAFVGQCDMSWDGTATYLLPRWTNSVIVWLNWIDVHSLAQSVRNIVFL
ncbi:hypothetical protein NDK43_32830 [Neobacillus pocheonensis]|uniref:Uncharacterized protein n=1 Tax=Neobacillus pocheonensis TaxID=363869 RepID=A0ABT0WIX6_9BACI|nr:hypothetical protein [Neobacillus pocheonensis]